MSCSLNQLVALRKSVLAGGNGAALFQRPGYPALGCRLSFARQGGLRPLRGGGELRRCGARAAQLVTNNLAGQACGTEAMQYALRSLPSVERTEVLSCLNLYYRPVVCAGLQAGRPERHRSGTD